MGPSLPHDDVNVNASLPHWLNFGCDRVFQSLGPVTFLVEATQYDPPESTKVCPVCLAPTTKGICVTGTLYTNPSSPSLLPPSRNQRVACFEYRLHGVEEAWAGGDGGRGWNVAGGTFDATEDSQHVGVRESDAVHILLWQGGQD